MKQIGSIDYTASTFNAADTDLASSLQRSFRQFTPLGPFIVRDTYRTQPALVRHNLKGERRKLRLDGGLVGNAHLLQGTACLAKFVDEGRAKVIPESSVVD